MAAVSSLACYCSANKMHRYSGKSSRNVVLLLHFVVGFCSKGPSNLSSSSCRSYFSLPTIGYDGCAFGMCWYNCLTCSCMVGSSVLVNPSRVKDFGSFSTCF